MQRSVTLRAWAGSRTWAPLLVAVLVSGCSGEAELRTELLGGEPGEPNDTSSNPASGNAALSTGGEAGRSDARPSPAGPSGQASDPSAPENGPAVNPVLSLAPVEVPSGDYCAPVSDWDPVWLQFEQEVLLLVNERRARPADCGEDGEFGPAGPVVMEPSLRCSARLQSLDMFERDFFDHTNPDGLDPFERMSAAGFHGSGAGENIAVGQTSPRQVMQSWMDSDDHCANVMRANYTMLGVGYHPGAGRRGLGSNFWTQNFGAPRGCGRNCR